MTPPPVAPLLAVDGLRRSFGGVHAVDGVSLGVSLGVGEGEVYGLIGPNGAGKTTLINLVSGLLRPDAGRVAIAGRDITGRPTSSLVAVWPAPTSKSASFRL